MATAGLRGELADDLTSRSTQLGFRILLLRRSAAKTPQQERLCFLARSTQSGAWIRRLGLKDPAELLALDLSVLACDEPPALGDPCEPIYTICTHGRRDPCCAEYGRSLIRQLNGADEPSLHKRVWESSHLGGHRFAANLACFPDAVFYGQVEPEEVGGVLDACRDGLIYMPRYRGRSAFSPTVQAADHYLRSRLGIRSLDDLQLVSEQETGANTFGVKFTGAGGEIHRVEVEIHEGRLRPESCNKDKLTPVRRYAMRYVDG